MASNLERIALDARHLTDDEMSALEASVAAEPTNREARAQLLGCYQMRQFRDEEIRDKRAEHIVWFIEHAPEDAFTGSHSCGMHDHDPQFPNVVAAWDSALAQHPESGMVVYNASRFFALVDRARAKALLERGEQLEPTWATWSRQLGVDSMRIVRVACMSEASGRALDEDETPEQLRTHAREGLAHFERALQLGVSGGNRMSIEQYAADAALACGDVDAAARHARAAIALAPSCADDRHLHDYLHFSHIALGQVAIAAGDRVTALAELVAAGAQGCLRAPVLRSFGPDFRLARSLLELGEREGCARVPVSMRDLLETRSDQEMEDRDRTRRGAVDEHRLRSQRARREHRLMAGSLRQ